MQRRILAVGVFALLVGVLAARRQVPVPDRWEYTVRFGPGSGINLERQQAQLDSLGREGWELITVLGVEMDGNTGAAALYLKRRAS